MTKVAEETGDLHLMTIPPSLFRLIPSLAERGVVPVLDGTQPGSLEDVSMCMSTLSSIRGPRVHVTLNPGLPLSSPMMALPLLPAVPSAGGASCTVEISQHDVESRAGVVLVALSSRKPRDVVIAEMRGPASRTLQALVAMGIGLGDACVMMTESPAAACGFSRLGRVEVGARASFLLLDEGLEMAGLVVRGRLVVATSVMAALSPEKIVGDPVMGRLRSVLMGAHRQLYGSELVFWLTHGLDDLGGFHCCLDEDGAVFDTTRPVLLQAQLLWSLSQVLFCHARRPQKDMELLGRVRTAAEGGARYLMAHARVPHESGVHLCLSGPEGGPLTPAAALAACPPASLPSSSASPIAPACAYVAALAKFAAVTGEVVPKREAKIVFDGVCAQLDAGLAEAAGDLATPVALLACIEELRECETTVLTRQTLYAARAQWAIDAILAHFHAPHSLLLDHIGAGDGATSLGRSVTPGLSLEAGWLLLRHSARSSNAALLPKALAIIKGSFVAGWDKTHGGFYHKLDAQRLPPTDLSWDMKLWWPACEGMVALALAFRETRDPAILLQLETILDYCSEKYDDVDHGGWYGYLDRQGRVTSRIKGGPAKGTFHTVRALSMVEDIVNAIILDMEDEDL